MPEDRAEALERVRQRKGGKAGGLGRRLSRPIRGNQLLGAALQYSGRVLQPQGYRFESL